ncbi:DinB family protein [Candidatus Fermentibacterales bacterium]|nr:DinB family protein [Candidatus Fermentibacterales bacterium]
MPDVRRVVESQYLASLEMLGNAVDLCPEELWDDGRFGNRFWRIAFHTLFYTHLYLQSMEEDFRPWPKHRGQAEHMGEALPWPPHDPPEVAEAYTKKEVLEYLDFCRREVLERTAELDVEREDSGFFWLPFGKLELQIYNIGHVRHHAGQLIERLRAETGLGVEWVGRSGTE